MKKFTVLFMSMILMFTLVPFAQAASFKDVSTSNSFYDEINYLVEKEIIQGFSDGTFRPNQAVTRAQAAAMIGRALGLDGSKKATQFADVSAGMSASGYIQAAANLGIIQGFKDGTFRPNIEVTRGQLAIFLGRAFNLTKTTTIHFTDVAANSSAYPFIGYLIAADITSGFSDGTFRPNVAVTRGQFSAFMTRTLKQVAPSGSVGYEVSAFEKEVLRLVNIERAEAKLAPLTLHVKLSEVARKKSQDMKDNNYFDHNSPVYGSPSDMMKKFGISYTAAAENIAKGYATPEKVVNGWMNSDGHRKNILNSNFTYIGIGHVASGNYWTQMFIRQ